MKCPQVLLGRLPSLCRLTLVRGTMVCLALGLVAGGLVSGQEPAASSVDADRVLPFVSETTVLIVKIDPTRIALPDLTALGPLPAHQKTGLQEASQEFAAYLQELQNLADGQTIYATVAIAPNAKQPVILGFRRKTSADRTQEVVAKIKDRFKIDAYVQGDYVVVGPKGARLPEMPQVAEGRQEAIASAFASVSEFPLQILVVPPEYAWRTLRELSPELPPQLGGGSSRVLTDGVQWVGVGLDLKRLRMDVIIQSADEQVAGELAARLPAMLRAAHKAAAPNHPKFPAELSDALLSWLKPQVEGSQVKLRVDGLERTAVNLAAISRILQVFDERARRNVNENSLKQFLLAMHNYYDTHRALPPINKHRDKDGKPYLSWRVHILPFLDQAELYDKFHLDEPWDSPHNKPLLEQMPDIYVRNTRLAGAGKLQPGYTTFLAPVGEKTVFGGTKATKFQDILDGTSNTIVLVEVEGKRAVPWTAPDDFSFDPKDPLAGILIGPDGKWLCAFADGSVHQLRKDIPAKTVIHLFQMNDGNPIEGDKLR